MKKAVVIFMLVLYGSATIGATVHMHYCMNRLTGITLWGNKGKACDNCGMAKDKAHGCCKDDCKQIRLQADQQLTSAADLITAFSAGALIPPVTLSIHGPASIVTVSQVSHKPPGLQKQKLYLQNRVWRI